MGYGFRKTTRYARYGRRYRRYGFKKTGKRMYFQLKRRVGKLARAVMRKRVNLYLGNDPAVGGATYFTTASPYQALPLTKFSNMKPLFGTDATDLKDDKAIMKSMSLRVRCSLESADNEEETTGFSVFLVSLRDTASYKIDTASGLLNALTADSDYYEVGAIPGDMAFLNNNVFKVHKYKRFTLTNFGSDLGTGGAQSQYGAMKEWSWKLRMNNLIRGVPNTAGETTWKTLNNPQDPSMVYYLLVFTDDASVDVEHASVTISNLLKFEKC